MYGCTDCVLNLEYETQNATINVVSSLLLPYFSSTFYSGNAITNPTEFAGVLGQWVHVHLYDKFLHDL